MKSLDTEISHSEKGQNPDGPAHQPFLKIEGLSLSYPVIWEAGQGINLEGVGHW